MQNQNTIERAPIRVRELKAGICSEWIDDHVKSFKRFREKFNWIKEKLGEKRLSVIESICAQRKYGALGKWSESPDDDDEESWDDDYRHYRCCGCCFDWPFLCDESELSGNWLTEEVLEEFRSKWPKKP